MRILNHNVTPKMVIGGTLGLIAVALGVRIWSQEEGGGGGGGYEGQPQIEPPRDNERGQYGHHRHHGHKHHHQEE